MSGVGGPPHVDFAVVGNAPETLRALRRILDADPGVRLLQDRQRGDGEAGRHTVGAVVEAPLSERHELPVHPDRLAVIFEDPVRLLAERPEPPEAPGAPGTYARTLAELSAGETGATLVLAADELASSGSCLRELLAHLGAGATADTSAMPACPPPIAFGRRATLFAAVRDDVEELERRTGRTFRSWRFPSDTSQSRVAKPDGRSLMYVGRRRDIAVPEACARLTEWDVLPYRLGPLLDRAESMTIVDPMSFPFDALRDSDRGIPVAVRLPRGWDPAALMQLFDEPLMAELTPFDAVNIADDTAWEDLRAHYSWPARMRVDTPGLLDFSVSRPGAPDRREKAGFRVARPAVLRQLRSAREVVPRGEREAALVVADDADRWGSLFTPEHTDLTVTDAEQESVHVALCAMACCSLSPRERSQRLRSVLGALRVGGRLVVLDRFLDGRAGRSVQGPTPRELMSEISEACFRHVVLEHVEALRYPGEILTAVGLFAFTKIGSPERP